MAQPSSAHRKATNFSWYKANASIHGIPDVLTSQSFGLRVVWITALLLALVGLGIQLSGVTKAFLDDSVGSLEIDLHPTRLPSVLICPTRLMLRGNFTEDEALYMKGFFPLIFNEIITDSEGNPLGKATNPKIDFLLSHRYNGSVRAMIADLATTDFIYKTSTSPPFASVNVTHIDTTYGACFLIAVDLKLTDTLAEYANYDAIFKVGIGKYGQRYPFRMFIGEEETVGVVPSVREAIELWRGTEYKISVRVNKKVRYTGRSGNRCTNYTKSDQRHCSLEPEAKFCLETEKCQTYLPDSTNRRTKSINHTYCNVRRSGALGCVISGFVNRDRQRGIFERCNVPCVEYSYDRVITQHQSEWLDTWVMITVSYDSLAYSKATAEYPLMNWMDYLAAVGGSAGLYFGASLLSFVQIVVCTTGSLYEKLRHPRHNRMAHEAWNSPRIRY